jgi:Xaa-Pro aminopeptidase
MMQNKKKVAQDRLAALRVLLLSHELDGYIILTTDAHQNEYVPCCWQRLAWVSGFTGSAGTMIVTTSQAVLWTDSRYSEQAAQQLNGDYFELYELNTDGTVSLDQWLKKNCAHKKIAVDSSTITVNRANALAEAVRSAGGELFFIENNLIDSIWDDQPEIPSSPVEIFPTEYAGDGIVEKLEKINSFYQNTFTQDFSEVTVVISMLDTIAWIFNLRGRDIQYNPVFLAFALINIKQGRKISAGLFLQSLDLSLEVKDHLKQADVTVVPYSQFSTSLRSCTGAVHLDPEYTSAAVQSVLKKTDCTIALRSSPIPRFKALKTEQEQIGMRQAHQRDAVAFIRLLSWLSDAISTATTSITEMLIDEKIANYRNASPLYVEPSFPTIAGFGAHGAIVHYRADATSNLTIDDSALLLIDCGAHYRDGTTDFTRTIHLGTPSAIERKYYTLVLKGHLALSRLIFPAGVDGASIDAIARAPLWSQGKNYGHGTGHGVGCFLNVHEFPPTISPRFKGAPLEVSMVVSNEPGYYEKGRFGIRIENLMMVQEKQQNLHNQSEPFFAFETLTLVPYCRKLIDRDLLNHEELDQINVYHQRVLANFVLFREQALESITKQQYEIDLRWLQAECAVLV